MMVPTNIPTNIVSVIEYLIYESRPDPTTSRTR